MAGNHRPDDKSREGGSRVYFDAVLHPHRSLTPRGFTALMAFAAAALCAVGMLFFLLGAWPVIGFCGLELLLLYLAFRVNYRDARACERIRLQEDGLEVSRIAPDGAVARCWRFAPNWLRVSIDEPPGHDSPLTLSSHGHSLAVGRFLTPEERVALAHALRDALDRWRCGATPAPDPGTP